MKITMKDVELELPDGTEVTIDGDKIHVKGSPSPVYHYYPAPPLNPPTWYPPYVTWGGISGGVTGCSTTITSTQLPEGTYSTYTVSN